MIGAGGDFSWTNIEGQVVDPFFGGKGGTETTKTDWVSSATVRVGYAFERVLLYAKGGAAWSHDTYGVQNVFDWGNPPGLCGTLMHLTSCNPNGTATRTGYAVGLGAEWAFVGNWTAGVEFDHYGFGTQSVTLTDPNVFPLPGVSSSAPINIKQSIEAAKVTLSYRFGPH